VLEAQKGDIPKAKSEFQRYNNHDKRLGFTINPRTNIMVPENMVYGSPEKRKELVLHAIQWSTADYPAVHNQTQPQKQSAAAPAMMGDEGDDEEDEARAEKTKKPPMAAQISIN
jgi:hypothetical protein